MTKPSGSPLLRRLAVYPQLVPPTADDPQAYQAGGGGYPLLTPYPEFDARLAAIEARLDALDGGGTR